jgi:tetratricopeptide (TPR) repeat protein
MEVIMKKIAFVMLLSFSILMSSDVIAKPDTEYEKAMQDYNKGNYKEAATLLKDYVKHIPDPVAYYRTGYALYKLKQFDEANEYFKQAYIIDPSFSPQAGAIKNGRVKDLKKPKSLHPNMRLHQKNHLGRR